MPLALLALLVAGTAVGAVVGQAGAPAGTATGTAQTATAAAQWVDEVMAATKAAGSAHLTYRVVSRSTVMAFDSMSSGHGVVDFARHRVSLTTVETPARVGGSQNPHSTSGFVVGTAMRTIAVGDDMWLEVGGGLAGNRWLKIPLPSDPSDRLGFSATDAAAALNGIEGPEPVVGVRTLGPATVGAVATTHYRVTTERPRPCNAQQAAVLRAHVSGPTDLWVDGRGRLVQAALTMHTQFHVPASLRAQVPSDVPAGPVVTTATLRLGRFGAPAHIIAPDSMDVFPPSASGHSFAVGGFRTCH